MSNPEPVGMSMRPKCSPMSSLLRVKHWSLFRGLQGFTQSGHLLPSTLFTPPQPQTNLTSHKAFAIAPPLLNGCSSTPLGLSSNATFSGMTSQQPLNAHTHAHFWSFFQLNFPLQYFMPTNILYILMIYLLSPPQWNISYVPSTYRLLGIQWALQICLGNTWNKDVENNL